MKNLSEAKTQIEEVKAHLDKIKKPALAKMKFVKADCGMTCEEEDDCCEVSKYDIEYLDYRISNLRDYISYIEDMFRSHMSGHLPSAPGPEAMQKALDALGWADNFEVAKKTIYASDGKVENSWLEIKNK